MTTALQLFRQLARQWARADDAYCQAMRDGKEQRVAETLGAKRAIERRVESAFVVKPGAKSC